MRLRTQLCRDCDGAFSFEVVRGTHGRPCCPDCAEARVQESKRLYKIRHREKVQAAAREYARKRYTDDPEHAARQRERSRALTPEAKRTVQKRWYEKNRDKHGHWPVVPMSAEEKTKRNTERTRRWVENNLERARAGKANRQARRRAWKLAVPNEPIDRRQVFERDAGKCHICGGKCDRGHFHLDHLVPLSKGGAHVYENVAVAHPACNLKRGPGRLPAQLRLVGDVSS